MVHIFNIDDHITLTLTTEADVPVEIFKWSDNRITRESIALHTKGSDTYDSVKERVVVVARDNDNKIRGVAASVLRAGMIDETVVNIWDNSIVIVDPALRNKGVGTKLLDCRLQLQKIMNQYAVRAATIASDNFASLKMALKAGYIVSHGDAHVRRNGEERFLALDMVMQG